MVDCNKIETATTVILSNWTAGGSTSSWRLIEFYYVAKSFEWVVSHFLSVAGL